MQVVGNARLRCENFNGVSDKLKKELIKSVGKSEILHFQLLNGSYDAALKREGFGASQSINLKDRVFDPYALNDEGVEAGAYVEIGVIEKLANGRVEKCQKFWVDSIANGIPGNGSFELMSNSIQDTEIYEFLCLSNGNRDNPHRDVSKEPRYYIKDFESERKTQQDKDFKDLQARFKLFSKQNPEEAKKLSELLPKNKEAATA